MAAVLDAYDKAIHDAPVRSVQMAQRLLAIVRGEVESGEVSREVVYARLVELYDFYEEHAQVEELEAVADVLDSFDGWSPLKAAIR